MAGPKVPLMAEHPVPSATPSEGSPTATHNLHPGPPRPTISLLPPKKKKARKTASTGVFLSFFSFCRPLPVFTFRCRCIKISTAPLHLPESRQHSVHGSCVTGTLFGYRKGRVSFALQDAPKRLPTLLVDLPIQTHSLFKEMGSGMVRIAFECEKQPENKNDNNNKNNNISNEKEKEKKRRRWRRKKQKDVGVLEESLWTVFLNGRKSGHGVKRDPSEDDLTTMALLHAVSTGAGVLPGRSHVEGPDGELAYMRAGFEHVVGSTDSETLYLLSPEGRTNGPDLTIFFVRV